MSSRALLAIARKELRVLAPMVAGCTALMLVGVAGVALHRNTLLFVYGLTSLGVGAHAFGQEFAHRTLATQLTLPVSRLWILAVKVAVALGLVVSLAVIPASLHGSAPSLRGAGATRFVSLVALASVTLAPALTLLCRSTLAGVVFSLATAAALWILGGILGTRWLGPVNAAGIDAFQRAFFWPAMYTICFAALLAMWRIYVRLEVHHEAGSDLHFPQWAGRDTAAAGAVTRRPPVVRLVQKELRLQQMTMLLALLFAVAIIIAGVGQVASRTWWELILPAAYFYAPVIAGLAGCLASAEERQLGTWSMQQQVPIAASRQWIVKVAVTLGVVLALGVVVPVLLSTAFPVLQHMDSLRRGTWLYAVLLASLGMYISALSLSGIRAVVGLVLTLPAIVMAAVPVSEWLRTLVRAGAAHYVTIPPRWERYSPFNYYDVTSLALSLALLALAFSNHRAADRSPWRVARQAALLAVLAAAVFAGELILRLWITR